MFDASDRSVLRIQLRNLRLNASLPPDTFTIR
jgi:outer membrane lipoprotein-sorting protein